MLAVKLCSIIIMKSAKAFIQTIVLLFQRRIRIRCRQRSSSLTCSAVQRIQSSIRRFAFFNSVHLLLRELSAMFLRPTELKPRFDKKLSSYHSQPTRRWNKKLFSCVIKIINTPLTSSSYRWTMPSRVDVCKKLNCD